jgi:hypothetical protein
MAFEFGFPYKLGQYGHLDLLINEMQRCAISLKKKPCWKIARRQGPRRRAI